MEKIFFIWLVILTILYCISMEFHVDVQKQLNRMNKWLHPTRKRPTLTREYIQEKNGIELSEEQYEKLAFLDVEAGGKYEAYEILRLLKVLGLI